MKFENFILKLLWLFVPFLSNLFLYTALRRRNNPFSERNESVVIILNTIIAKSLEIMQRGGKAWYVIQTTSFMNVKCDK